MADNNEVLQNITARLDMIYGKLTVIEGLIRDNINTAVKEESEDISGSFLSALVSALESGEYCLLPRKKKDRTTSYKGKVLGIYDELSIVISSQLAYKLYKGSVKKPLSIQFLWQELERLGIITSRGKKKERRIDGKLIAAITLFSEKTKALISANNKGQADIRAHIKPTE